MSYTERFTEGWAYLGGINPASYNTVQDTGNLLCEEYARLAIIVHAGVMGGNCGFDIEEATTSVAGTRAQFDSGNKDLDLVATTDDNTVSVIEIKAEEFTVGTYSYINVECTPAAASIFSVQVWGGEARHKPVSTTTLDSVTD